MAIHSSILAWRIPWTEEPGRLQSLGCWVRHNWETSLSLFTFMHWKRKWQPTPVFLPGESQGWGSLVGCQSMGSHRGGHDWSDLAATAAWNLERQYQQSYMQNCKGDTDVKNRLLDSVGEGEGGMSWENVIVTCILPYVKQMTKCKFDIWSRIPKASTQAPPSLGFSRQEYWSGLPFPFPMHESEKWKWSLSVVSDSAPQGL